MVAKLIVRRCCAAQIVGNDGNAFFIQVVEVLLNEGFVDKQATNLTLPALSGRAA